jgi:hypothetical protein
MTCVVILSALSLSCSSSTYRDVYPTLLDGKYDSEFPYRGCSEQLETISHSVVMISCVAYYRTYSFSFDEHITLPSIGDSTLENRKSTVEVSQIAGTGTIIAADDRRVVLLTCAHVVDFPDSIISYFIGSDQRSTGIVQAAAYVERQIIYVAVFPEGGEMTVLAMDRGLDLALVGRRFEKEHFPFPRVFSYPVGRARELEWGSFVYLFGYPGGFKTVTKAIVSSPNRDRRGSFLVDAVLDRGFSGGIVLAIRDGVPNFELVGIIKMLPGHTTSYLAPATGDGTPEYNPHVPYTGQIFVQKKLEIINGVCQAVPAEVITEFVEQHRDDLVAEGYPVPFAAPER